MKMMQRLAGLLFAFFAFVTPVLAQGFTITDIAGRQVHFDKPVSRVVLGEGRMIYAIAAIESGNPFSKVVAWRNDLWLTDLDLYNAYVAKYPKVKDLPFIGSLFDGTLQPEMIIALHPDVVLLPIGNKQAAEEGGFDKALDSAGIKLVYIDFRQKILEDTVPSLHILGQVFGQEQRANEVAAYSQAQLARVESVLKKANAPRPSVFMYRAAGLLDCCATFGPGNFGLMVELAGGRNIGSDFLPSFSGTINPEQVIASNPDVIVATGSNWTHAHGMPNYVKVGPDAAKDADAGRAALKKLMQDPAFTGSKAVANGKVYAIWHQFYDSPYQFVAIQQLAKWFHPDLFKDLDPDATFADFSKKFLPLPYQPGYWLSIRPKG
ncbi:ABC transporter substrate-binding protein [Jiella sp. MQZ9-1]|uniref:ABC transporter substrate-binding protein n=1 Tax=Jiella flava TaxID=2816857 RepID=A0A939JVB6_9HYPH|nr:ABC transporter substrate-binding protein [Jiella flava]MBO0661822.1 ABC transporter substrate-binding protein [Jiella flava]MCD2470462.1 ABC transporter substrate-binding protein [Jiella flava]